MRESWPVAAVAPDMAKHIIAPAYGGPEVLQFVDVTVPPPGQGEVTIDVKAVGVNPTDYKSFSGAYGVDESKLPIAVGNEVAGVVAAVGPDTEIASGPVAIGDAVLAYRVPGGYTEQVTVRASDVFAKPDALDFPAAANLLLVGATAADMLRVVPASAGSTVVVHGASGAVGVSLLQQLAQIGGVRVIGTASEARFDEVRRFGGEPVAYGDGLLERLQALAPEGLAAAYDTVGTDEAVDVSLALVSKDHLISIASSRSRTDGFKMVGGGSPDSAAFRETVRAHLIGLAASGALVVPVAATYPLAQAAEALAFLQTGHPGGKLALIP